MVVDIGIQLNNSHITNAIQGSGYRQTIVTHHFGILIEHDPSLQYCMSEVLLSNGGTRTTFVPRPRNNERDYSLSSVLMTRRSLMQTYRAVISQSTDFMGNLLLLSSHICENY
jgi:hypothetical protein